MQFSINQNFTQRAGSSFKHVFVGTQRLVTKRAEADNHREPLQWFYHTDHLQSTSYLTNSRGDLEEYLAYFPYGETWVEEHPSMPIEYAFSAKELDPETGYYYFGARYYDPRVSVWVSADPALGKYLPSASKQLPGMGGVYNSLNLGLYTYAHQNPLTVIDIDGRWSSKKIPDLGLEPVHQKAIANVLTGQASARGISIMQQRQVVMDEKQVANFQYSHAMMDDRATHANNAPKSRDAQIKDAEFFIGERMSAAKMMAKAGNLDAAYSHLGDAIHTAQDATSPSHKGFQNWNKQNTGGHIYGENQYPAVLSGARTELEGATQWMHDIFTGKAKTPSQFFNPKTGVLNIPPEYLQPPIPVKE